MKTLPPEFPDRRVCVMGLGYVGLTLAATMADVGFDVLGVEIRKDVVDRLTRGDPHFYEPGLRQLLAKLISRNRIRVSQHIPGDWKGTIYIVTVGTPLGSDGRARLDMVENVSREIAEHLNEGDMVIMRSTVKLGATRSTVVPILNRAGVKYDIAFCPERTIEGRVLVELRELPQIVGGASAGARMRAAQLFSFLTATVVQVSDLETAEMIKLIDNTQRDVWFGFANEVAQMCDAIGVNVMEVVNAGKLGYARSNLALPGPVGGPCLEKDSYILAEGLKEFGFEPSITLRARQVNERQPFEVADKIRAYTDKVQGFPNAPRISILGLAFKGRPATDDLRGTMARPILAALAEAYPAARFGGYDALVDDKIIAREFDITSMPTLEDAFEGAHLVVIANNHPAFGAMPLESLAAAMARPGLIYDFWNNFDSRELTLPDETGYMALGSHGLAALPGNTA